MIEVQLLARELQDLHRTTEIMAEITTMFRERDLLVPQYVVDKEIKKERYHDMMKDEIREFVSMSSCWTLEEKIAMAREWEIYLETVRKRRSV